MQASSISWDYPFKQTLFLIDSLQPNIEILIFFPILFHLWSWATLLICFLAWLYLLIGHSATHPQPLSEKIKILRPIREEFLVLKLLPVPKELIFQKKMVSKHLLKVLDEKYFFCPHPVFYWSLHICKIILQRRPPLNTSVSGQKRSGSATLLFVH